MNRLRAFLRVLLEHRSILAIDNLEKRTSFLTPSDWFVVGTLGIVMALAAGTLLAAVSLALTVEVPTKGGTYTEGLIESARFVNPLLALSDTDRDLTALIFSGLLKSNPDGSLSPDLASSYSVSENNLTYTFVLSEQARFHDGTPVTANDVAFTIRQAQNPDIKSPRRADWEGVTVTVVDSKTVTFTLKSPYAPFLENTTLGILPKHVWGAISAEEFPFSSLNGEPVGSGPYFVSSVKRNSSGIPTEYHLEVNAESSRVPYISHMVFKFYSNTEELQNALTEGAVQAAHSIATPHTFNSSKMNEAIFGRVFGVFFNQNQNGIFSEIPVRKALDAAVDKQALVSTVLGGHGSVIDGPLPPDSVESALPARLSEQARIETAQAILTKAGWKLGADGIFAKTVTVKKKKTTKQLSFALSTSNVPELKSAAEMVAADWKALGAKVEVKFFDQNDLNVSVIRPRKYDALLFGLVVGRDLDLFAFWHSSQRNDPGLNIALYANIATDKKLEALRTESDPEVRLQKASSIGKDISADTAAVFLYAPHFLYITPPQLSGMTLGTIATPSDRFLSVDQWYLTTERIWPIFGANLQTLFKKITHH